MTTQQPKVSTSVSTKREQSEILFSTALAKHQQGQVVEAQSLYKKILELQPDHFDSMHLLGVSHIQGGELELGAELIGQALIINPESSFAHNNLGKALKDLNRLDEALASFDQALELSPNYPEALNNRGNLLFLLERLEEAAASFKTALTIKPNYPEAWHNLAKTLKALEKPEEAIKAFNQALLLRPAFVDALLDRCKTLVELERHQEALENINSVLSITQQNPEAYNSQGTILLKLDRPADALKSFEAALRLKPDFVNAIANYGAALLGLERPSEALATLNKAVKLNPESPEAHFYRANALNNLKQFDEALVAFDEVIKLDPQNIEALINKGNTLIDLRRIGEGLETLDLALAKDPERATIKFNQSLVRLLVGDFSTGWPLYENRWDCKDFASRRSFSNPSTQWTGTEPLAGKSILIYAEQGLGDSIQFVRYIKLVAELGARVILEVQPRLVPLLSDLEGVDVLVQHGQALPHFDYHCPLLSLPLAFKTELDSIPLSIPYLKAHPDRIKQWGDQLGRTGFKIGICWKGNAKPTKERSIPIEYFHGLSKIPQVRLISLHKGDGEKDLETLPEGMTVEVLGAEFDSQGAFMDTVAVMKCCDLVITNDTSVAHVAGALGVPTWVALMFLADWRWMLDREDSPWYPTMRLFRQKSLGDWQSALDQMESALRTTLGEPK